MVKVLARIRKVARKKMQSLHLIRRRRIKRTFNAIIARSGVIMHLNVNPREYQGARVIKLNLLKMETQILKKFL